MSSCNCTDERYHPRPDLHRGTVEGSDWVDLNGQWDFRFDPEDVGETESWCDPEASFDRTIRVPFPWEAHAAWGTEAVADCDDYFSRNAYLNPSEVSRDNYRQAARHTIGWYKRTFQVPAGWSGQRVILHIGAADWHVRVWVNGQAAGESESGYLPVEFDITDCLVDGENTVTCRVQDPQDEQQKPLGKQHDWYTTTSGIWQPVWLAPRPEAHIADVRLTPTVSPAAVTVEVTCGACTSLQAESGSAAGQADGTTEDAVAETHAERSQRLTAQINAWVGTGKSAAEVFNELNRLLQVEFLGGRITPGELTQLLELVIRNYGVGVSISVCDDSGRTIAEGELAGNGRGGFEGTIPLGDEAQLWSPDNPALYHATAALRLRDDVLDTVHCYFGLREIGIGRLHEGGPNYITLNGTPVYLKGALDQSFNPWGVYSYLCDDAIREHLQQAKDAGFNFLRVHIKLEDPRYLYWADRLGILLQCDLPSFGYDGYSDLACQRHEALLRGAVRRDYNHPCIFSWCLFNETWGLGGNEYKRAAERQEWVEQMYQLARELDGSRLIEDNSPCLHDHVVTDINSWHFYLNDYERAAEHIAGVVDKSAPGSDFNFVPGRSQGEQPLMNSEYGGISARMGDKDVSWCFKFLTDLLREQERVCGYVYTELHDIEWERNGIYNYDGSAKEFGYSPADLQADPYFAFGGPPGETVEPGGVLRLPVFLARQGCGDTAWPDIEVRVTGVDDLGEAMDSAPTGKFDWKRGDEAAGLVSRGAYVLEGPLPAYPCLLRLEARVNGRFSDFKYLEVHSGRLPAVEELPDGSVVLRKLAGEQEHSSGWHEAELERGLIGREIHLLGGIEAGHLDYTFKLPEGVDLADVGGIILIAELSAKMQDARQTEAVGWPSGLEVSMNGCRVHCRTLGDQYADSRGALSHMHGFWGRYGELVRVEVASDMVNEIAAADGGCVRLRLAVPGDGRPGGLIAYSSRAGRYPVDLTVVLRFR